MTKTAHKNSVSIKEEPLISAFEFLSKDHNMIESNLKKLLANYKQKPKNYFLQKNTVIYDKSSRDKFLEESTIVFDEIRRHLTRHENLCFDWIKNHSKDNKALNQLLKKSIVDQKDINDNISDLVMLHVDEQSFLINLKQLLKNIDNHIKFSEKELFPKMQKHMAQDELNKINLRLNEMLIQNASFP